jgi:hypothetical protein
MVAMFASVDCRRKLSGYPFLSKKSSMSCSRFARCGRAQPAHGAADGDPSHSTISVPCGPAAPRGLACQASEYAGSARAASASDAAAPLGSSERRTNTATAIATPTSAAPIR